MNAFEKWLEKQKDWDVDIDAKNISELIIAKHRELCHHDKCKAQQIIAFEQGIAEGYAKGKADGRLKGMKEQHAIEYKDKNEAYEHGKAEGYQKGQADLRRKGTEIVGDLSKDAFCASAQKCTQIAQRFG